MRQANNTYTSRSPTFFRIPFCFQLYLLYNVNVIKVFQTFRLICDYENATTKNLLQTHLEKVLRN